jgi:5-formyltetrahydrofolate cyclo-ligase
MIKTKFRKSLKRKLSLMSEREIIKTSATIQLNCLNYVKTLKHENVLIYMPSKSEVKTDAIRKKMLNKNKKVYIPRVLEENKLHFNKFVSEDNLVINKFNILESIDQAILPAEKFDLLILPFVGIDKKGSRLGHGGGYYDRALQDLKYLNDKAIIIGLGYEFQLINDEFGEPHDLKFDLVFTEQGFHIY